MKPQDSPALVPIRIVADDRELLESFGSVEAVMRASLDQLEQIEGIGSKRPKGFVRSCRNRRRFTTQKPNERLEL